MLPLIIAILVLVWAWRTRKPWSELGLQRPRSWIVTIVTGIVFGIAFKFFMKAVVMPLLGAPPQNQAFRWLEGNTAALPGFILTLVFSAGFAEEVFWRGYLFERSRKWFGSGAVATVLTVIVTSVLFGLAHWQNQKLPGVEQAIVTGLVFGAIFARTRSLWFNIAAHAAFDLTAAWMIYYGLETRIATFFFK